MGVLIQNAIGWTMGYKKVYFLWNGIPDYLLVLWHVLKSITHVIRTVRRPKDFDSFDLNILVFQVNAPFFQLMYQLLFTKLTKI